MIEAWDKYTARAHRFLPRTADFVVWIIIVRVAEALA